MDVHKLFTNRPPSSSTTTTTTTRPSEDLLPRHKASLQEWGELLHIAHLLFKDRQFGQLSQGQQKLGIIARALIGAPPLIIMDEACQVGGWMVVVVVVVVVVV